MPIIIDAILEALAAVWAWMGETLWPWLAAGWKTWGLPGFLGVLWAWMQRFFAKEIIEKAVATGLVIVGLGLWATFLGAFWTWASSNGLREMFSANPLTGAPAGALYLVSYAFPLKMMFGLAFAYIQWKFTYIEAAIVLNRLVKLVFGF